MPTMKKNTLMSLVGKPTEEELNEELVWANLKAVDSMVANKLTTGLSPVAFMGMAAQAYFKLHPDKTPADLEKEFRARKFDTGLIAAPWRQDKNLCPLVEGGQVMVRMPKDFRKEDAPNCEYYVMYSCRPRSYAEEEMLQYATNSEVNLKRLETAGDLNVKNKENLTEETIRKAEEDAKKAVEAGEFKEEEEEKMGGEKKTQFMDPTDADFISEVGKGKLRLQFQTVCMETAWKEAHDANPGAEICGVAMMAGGAILTVLAENGAVVCPYGRMTVNGEVQCIPLSSVKLN